jgi:hypothetical protein
MAVNMWFLISLVGLVLLLGFVIHKNRALKEDLDNAIAVLVSTSSMMETLDAILSDTEGTAHDIQASAQLLQDENNRLRYAFKGLKMSAEEFMMKDILVQNEIAMSEYETTRAKRLAVIAKHRQIWKSFGQEYIAGLNERISAWRERGF